MAQPSAQQMTARNPANDHAPGSPPVDTEPEPKNAVVTASQEATSWFVRFLVMSSIGSFMLSWIPLALYTAVKDFTRSPYLADPADAFLRILKVFPTKAKGAPDMIARWAKFPVRLAIYPIGGLLIMAVLTIITIFTLLIYAYLNKWSVIAHLLGIA